jgi:hypothetical protein
MLHLLLFEGQTGLSLWRFHLEQAVLSAGAYPVHFRLKHFGV